MEKNNKYTKMQQEQYDREASEWSLNNRNPVVGSFEDHNAWSDYDVFLFKNVETNDKVALDFGCGPGRNIVKFANRFKRIDGVDISKINTDKAWIWAQHNNVPFEPNLYKCNGTDLSNIFSEVYDVVFSTICLQHICVHEIRLNLFKEFYRVLKNGAHLCLQMGYGPSPNKVAVGYYENNYDATATNGSCDVRIENVDDLKKDIESVGFKNFEFDIRPNGPGDGHSNWIFFRATK